jgi:hypothetical protein
VVWLLSNVTTGSHSVLCVKAVGHPAGVGVLLTRSSAGMDVRSAPRQRSELNAAVKRTERS